MYKNVLVLAAHPDDETLGCGATLARLSAQGSRIKLITFTDGTGARGDGLGNRNQRLEKVCKILGISEFCSGCFPDNRLDTVALLDLCQFIEGLITVQPDLVLTHHPECLNVDHQMVYRSTVTVFRPQLAQSMEILSYFVPSSSEWNPRSHKRGNVYIDARDFLESKLQALRCYDEEMRPYPHPRSFQSIENQMKTNGNEVGLELAEKFELIRSIQV